MLTHEQVKRLNEPFNPEEHEFLRGFIYITEFGIVARLSEIDPSWNWEVKNQYRNGNQVITIGTLTVCGVSRDGVGEATAEYKNDRQMNEAEKSSVTDALKRASRLFGVGSYLLQTPDWVKSVNDVAKWLNAPTSAPKPTPPTDFMDTKEYEGNFVFVDTGMTKSGEQYAVFESVSDKSIRVSVFKTDRRKFANLAEDQNMPKAFNGVVVQNGKFWNLKHVNSF